MKNLLTRVLFTLLCVMMVACSSSTGTSDSETAKFTAGKYTGSAPGNNGDVEVEVELSETAIVSVNVTNHSETAGISEPAIEQVPAAIVESQTWDVDTVSGATNTSKGIINATKAALSSAGVDVDSLAVAKEEEKSEEKADSASSTSCEMSLDNINTFLNESADMGEGSIANVVAVIPINHVNGPRDEHDFYAFVNFKYKARNYIKYQITYLSCTCRSADVNYWMTAYVELTLPESGNLDDAEIRYLSYDLDSAGHYLGGFWGDSNPTPAGATYEMFKEEYIPFFTDKPYSYIKTLDFVEDISAEDYSAGEGRSSYTLDTFSGSSVSTNNIIRMLNALFEYHGTDAYFE